METISATIRVDAAPPAPAAMDIIDKDGKKVAHVEPVFEEDRWVWHLPEWKYGYVIRQLWPPSVERLTEMARY